MGTAVSRCCSSTETAGEKVPGKQSLDDSAVKSRSVRAGPTDTAHEKTRAHDKPRVDEVHTNGVETNGARPEGVAVVGDATIDKDGVVQFGYRTNFEKYYRLGKELGKGQYGTTYVCEQLSNGARYAAKIIAKKNLTNKQAIEDVQKEVKIFKTLKGNSNIVEFYDVFEDNRTVTLVLELCTGGELFDRIVKNGKYSEADASTIVRQILQVVAACHLKGVIHRDLKPENFLFASPEATSFLKVTDFGLSDFFTPESVFSDVAGSAYYVAPEVLQRRYGPQSDLWSVGVIMYILLCGEPPFFGNTETAVFRQILKGQLDLERGIWKRISPEAKDLIRKLLQRDPKARLTASQALAHPWVGVQGVAPDTPLDYAVLNHMKQFSGFGRLRQLMMKTVAMTFDDRELADLKQQFKAMDEDGNGVLTYNEVRQALRQFRTGEDRKSVIPDSQIDEILTAMDSDGNGEIDYMEFVAATLQLQQLERGDRRGFGKHLKEAFDRIDTDKSGFIEFSELQQAVGDGADMEELRTLMAEVDKNNDGVIDYHEFCALMSATRPKKLFSDPAR